MYDKAMKVVKKAYKKQKSKTKEIAKKVNV